MKQELDIIAVNNISDLELLTEGLQCEINNSIYDEENPNIISWQKESAINGVMTQRENELLKIAKEIISLNEGCNAALTGSLMLRHRGFKTRRNVIDIDIIVDELDDDSLPKMPEGWKQTNQNGRGSTIDAMQFEKNDVQIDFLSSEEERESVKGINCGTVQYLLSAKRSYTMSDSTDQSKAKHELDIAFLTNQIKQL